MRLYTIRRERLQDTAQRAELVVDFRIAFDRLADRRPQHVAVPPAEAMHRDPDRTYGHAQIVSQFRLGTSAPDQRRLERLEELFLTARRI